MRVVIINELQPNGALLGMGLSYGKSLYLSKEMLSSGHSMPSSLLSNYPYKLDWARADKLAVKDGGHNEFLKHVTVQLLIEAPETWWAHADQYKVAWVDLSTSLMHNALDRYLTQDDFEDFIPNIYLELLANNRDEVIEGRMPFERYVNRIPRGYLYTRVVTTNYLALRNIIKQRENHKLPYWGTFCNEVKKQVNYPEWLEMK